MLKLIITIEANEPESLIAGAEEVSRCIKSDLVIGSYKGKEYTYKYHVTVDDTH